MFKTNVRTTKHTWNNSIGIFNCFCLIIFQARPLFVVVLTSCWPKSEQYTNVDSKGLPALDQSRVYMQSNFSTPSNWYFFESLWPQHFENWPRLKLTQLQCFECLSIGSCSTQFICIHMIYTSFKLLIRKHWNFDPPPEKKDMTKNSLSWYLTV